MRFHELLESPPMHIWDHLPQTFICLWAVWYLKTTHINWSQQNIKATVSVHFLDPKTYKRLFWIFLKINIFFFILFTGRTVSLVALAVRQAVDSTLCLWQAGSTATLRTIRWNLLLASSVMFSGSKNEDDPRWTQQLVGEDTFKSLARVFEWLNGDERFCQPVCPVT